MSTWKIVLIKKSLKKVSASKINNSLNSLIFIVINNRCISKKSIDRWIEKLLTLPLTYSIQNFIFRIGIRWGNNTFQFRNEKFPWRMPVGSSKLSVAITSSLRLNQIEHFIFVLVANSTEWLKYKLDLSEEK